MIFSKKCEYAIRALTHLAHSGPVCHAREISRSQNVPYHFMAKVLQALNHKGFVRSSKGAGGGFRLAQSPQRIRLIDVLVALDGDEMFTRCLYGFKQCSHSAPCPLHHDWKILKADIETHLRSQTIAQLAANGEKKL